MSRQFNRLYTLKGRIGLVGDDRQAIISFCLPGKDTKLVYFNIDFTSEEMNQPPDVFLRNLKHKVDDLSWDWIKHVRSVNKESSSTQD
jgi:hypothetical protein